ncbi:MAG: DNA polymerase III subunit delta [Flavobacteriales bacterium]|nr:DNA polymerase III subunit delta [Flavobacteriales bacterium]MCB9447602.1 DNA polymerase III subunit delta [Flavobacteriales bacterium]
MKKFDQILGDLKKQIYHPVYFLAGEEPYYIDQISNYIAEHVLTESEREFNQTILYGRDTSMDAVLVEAKRFPMMANYQVVIVREAQHLKNLEVLESYMQKPQSTTILVFCYKYKNPDKRKSYVKAIDKKGVLFVAERLRDYQVPDWIERYLAARKFTITPKATVLLTEYLGTDLDRIHNALQKLIITDPPDHQITPELIERYIGINNDYNSFELQKAIGTGNIAKANQIVNYFARNEKEHPMVLTMGSLYYFFSKLLLYHVHKRKPRNELAAALRVNPYFLKDYERYAKHFNPSQTRDAIRILRDYDLKSKGVGNASNSQGELLQEMVWRLMHA